MMKKVIKIAVIVLLLWIVIFAADFMTVACFGCSPIFCIRNDENKRYSGLGYSYVAYAHPITGEYQYCLYIFGCETISTFTN